MAFKLVIKDGDTKYKMKNGVYNSKTVDLVQEYETLGEALAEFLYTVNDEYNEDMISLVFKPKKKK